MAFYISLIKMEEDEHSATYIFYLTSPKNKEPHQRLGIIRFSKEDGSAEVLQDISDDERGICSVRAHAKLRKCWQEGHLPDKTAYSA